MTSLLKVERLSKSFGGLQAVADLSFEVAEGQILGIIGPNGAGKTTAVNLVSGVIKPTSGQVLLGGKDVTGQAPHILVESGLVRTFQIARGLPRLSVLENLLLYGAHQPGERMLPALLRLASVRRREEALITRAVAIARRLNLFSVIGNPASDLSGGQKKLLEIGRALMTEPKLILLDEPVAGVNPTLAREIGEHLKSLVREGITILLIEHHMDMVARLCDRVVVLAEGRHLAEGPFDEVAANPAVQEAYMGRRRATVA